MVDIAAILKENGLAAGMSEDCMRKLCALAVDKEFAPGDKIVEEDASDRDIYIVYSGMVSFEMKNTLANTVDSSKEHKYEIFFYKGIVGELSFIDGIRRSATVVAMDNVKALLLPFDPLHALIESDHDLGYVFVKNLCSTLTRKVRHSSEQLKNQMLL